MIATLLKSLKDRLDGDIHIKEIIFGTGLTFTAKVIGSIAGFGTSFIVAHYYGTDMVGTLAIINAVLGVSIVFGLMGTDVAVLRLIPEFSQKYSVQSVLHLHKKMVIIVMLLSLITTAALAISSPFISHTILKNDSMHTFLIITSAFVIIKSLSVLYNQTIWGLQQIKIYAVMQSFPLILNFLLIYLLTFQFYHDNNPLYAFFINLSITFILLVVLVSYIFSKKKSSCNKNYKVPFNYITSISFPMFLSSAIFVVIYQCDTLMLSIYETEREVGIYTIALKLAVLTNFVLISIQSVATPKFSELFHKGNLKQLKIVVRGSTFIAFWLIMPIILISVLFGKEILALFGEEFTVGYTALLFLLTGQFVNVVAGPGAMILNMTGHEKLFRNIIIFSGTLNITLNALLIPRFDINGAAIATMTSTIAWNGLAAWYTKQKLGFSSVYIPSLRRIN